MLKGSNLRNVLFLIMAVFVYKLGKYLTLILIYASPDNITHSTEASIFFLGSSIFLFVLYFKLNSPLHIALKVLFILFGIYIIIDSLMLTYVAIFANPLNTPDINAGMTFILSTILLCTGLYFMIRNSFKKVINV